MFLMILRHRRWDKAVRDGSSSLQFVRDWFVTREEVDMWHDDCYDDDDGDRWDYDNEKGEFETMVIKSERHKKKRLRKNSCLLLGIDQDIGIGICQKIKRKKKGGKIMGINIGFFLYLTPGYKKFFDPKRTANKGVFCVECF